MVTDTSTDTGAGQPSRRRELGGFLRAHRERLRPADLGLPEGRRRRTPGLRREEVAALSGVGVAWYSWLEQGRVETSRHVLDAVSRTLRLDATAHAHALTLAGYAAPEQSAATHDPNTLALMESWTETPAVALDPALFITAWNEAYARLWPDPGRIPAPDRNLLLLLLTDPAHQRLLPAWEPVARDLHRHFRGRADRSPDDDRVRRLSARLREARSDLDAWWSCRSVGDFASRTVDLVPAPPAPPLRSTMTVLRPGTASGTDAILVQRLDRS
ncbi:helix-turn-helix domain-containing protein [Streptomyces sp. NBC_00083]|uniref:MmyB family transcriptional regulator n=1 Tax=Streptomyces sp. NBC_00083 TaxID=2975647 RepID=UPI0022523F51|nr:helix-turn-helix domain-containing protein [Streptomyces sp. NBC_00083]MCX5385271.1 helix-turn-helix domain-containing protein [Streptomyces sp. NBC_00083]